VIWRVRHFDQIESTNTWLAAQALEGAPEGLVAFADFQTKGRGRLDRTWSAASGTALLCSVLLRPALDLDEMQLGVAAVSLAVRAATVRLCGVRPDLKWPNDLLVGDRKVGGVLAEVVATSDGVALVVGVGVNLTDCPEGATSLAQVAGVTVAPRAMLDIVLEELETRRDALDDVDGRAAVHAQYERALATLGQLVRVEMHGTHHVGVARAVDAAGRLILEVDGEDHVVSAGDVVHVRPHDGGS